MVEPIRGYGLNPRRAPRGPGGFRLPGETPAAAPASPAAPAGGVTLAPIAQGLSPEERDAAARRRGQALLSELAGLQASMLRGGVPESALRRLAALAEGEAGDDPGLREILDGLSLRARVELARLGR